MRCTKKAFVLGPQGERLCSHHRVKVALPKIYRVTGVECAARALRDSQYARAAHDPSSSAASIRRPVVNIEASPAVLTTMSRNDASNNSALANRVAATW